MIREIQAATFICAAPGQYWITTEAAEISAHRVIALEYQFYSANKVSIGSWHHPRGEWKSVVPIATEVATGEGLQRDFEER